jgi:cytochrome o ubiquinol oxidase subunit 1
VNTFFGVATMIIAVPTGVKIFNWLFTMYRGRVTLSVPMLWTIGFISTFAIGGMTGVLMSVPAVDFQVHNSVFLVAHFHNVIIGGVVFGYLAGVTYWFPKIFGFKLNEKLGKFAFWFWITGFYLAFMPLYILGLMGMTRRLNHYAADTGWHPFLLVAALGTALVAIGVVFQIAQLVVSFKNRKAYRDVTGDPWDGRTLEWSIPSPAPFYNFAFTPEVNTIDAFWEEKQRKLQEGVINHKPIYQDIHMPKNTGTGFIIGMLSGVFGFGMIWHSPLMITVGLAGIAITLIARSFNFHTDYYVKAAEVERIESGRFS